MKARMSLVIAMLVAAAGCSRVGAPAVQPYGGPSGSVVTVRSLSGVATLAGQRLLVVVEVATDSRGRGSGHLEIPDLSLTAEGTATLGEDDLELDLRYGGDCPGRLRIRGKRTSGGNRIEGTLTAEDCTGKESGTVFLEVTARAPGSPGNSARVESAAGGI